MSKASLLISAIVLSILLTSCMHRGPLVPTNEPEMTGAELLPSGQIIAQEDLKSELGEVPMEVNKLVEKWLAYFQGRGKKHMERYLERSGRYLPLMKEILRQEGVPSELVYIALIESGFSSSAHSHAGAVGYWQFIRGTGKAYGLKINAYMDERQDFVLATRAAGNYFKSLYNLFGDWYISMASYNAGENRLKRLIMRHQTNDFWWFAKNRKLPRETINYVPKYIAARMIASNPKKYGFTGIEFKDALSFESFEVPHAISLKKLAKTLQIDYKLLKSLNPTYRSHYVPYYKNHKTIVKVPKGFKDQAVAVLDQAKSGPPKFIAGSFYYYRVRSGDNLSTIAARHRTSVRKLRSLNGMWRRSLIRVGQKLKVPERGGYRRSSASYSLDGNYYKVRRGDNLSLIAGRFGVSIGQLKKLNNMNSRTTIYVGQKLKVKQDGAPASRSTAQNSASSGSTSVYKVQRGDNLSTIAERHSMGVGKLRRINNLRGRSTIYVGQKLKVTGDVQESSTPSNSAYHIVRQGDNLIEVADKHGVSLNKLRKLNGLFGRSTIYVGQKLKLNGEASGPIYHRVGPGESLYVIAKKYGMSVRELKRINNMRGSLIKVGDRIVIKTEESASSSSKSNSRKRIHIVRRGETLIHIAKKYELNLQKLAQHNDIRNKSRIFVGMQIAIP